MKYVTVTVRGLPLDATQTHVQDNFNPAISQESPCVVSPLVDEIHGTSRTTTVTFRNEKKGRKRSVEEIIRLFNGSSFRGLSSTISVADHFIGLTPLSGAADAPIHVYFVHGIGGHAFRTWSSDVDDDIAKLKAWPRDFLPSRLKQEKINARIYTLGYNANSIKRAAPNATISSHAEDLLANLLADRSNTVRSREIYFVCHSLGGLIVCQALIMALFKDENYINKPAYRDLFWLGNECLVKGMCFMGTPFLGSGQANLLAPFVGALKDVNYFSATNEEIVKSLRENKESLEVPTIVQRFKYIVDQTKIRLLIGCEERPVAGSKLTVTRQSATTIFNDTAVVFGINNDHRAMVKFDDPNNQDYKRLESLIVKMILDRFTSQPLATTPDGEAAHGGARPTPSHQALSSPSSPDRGNNETSQQNSTAHAGITLNFFDRRFSEYQDQSLSTFTSPGIPSRQQTVPTFPTRPPAVPNHQAPLSDPSVPTELPGASNVRRSREAHAQTAGMNGDDDPLNRLNLFETVFIVDDTGSMILPVVKDTDGPDRWDVTKEALCHIAEIAAKHDSNGIDVAFLKDLDSNTKNIKSGDTVQKIVDSIDLYDGRHGGGTEFLGPLEEVIDPQLQFYRNYLEQFALFRDGKLSTRPEKPKFLNLIVVTDGQADDEQEVEEYIIKTARELDDMKAPTAYIGIEFVQIGDDARATKFLQDLDDELVNQDPPIRDIVDTTPFKVGLDGPSFGDLLVQKALLGGVTKKLDKLKNSALGS